MRCGLPLLVAACAFDPSTHGASAGLGEGESSSSSGGSSEATSIGPTATSAAATTSGPVPDAGPIAPEGWTARRQLTVDVNAIDLAEPQHDVPLLVMIDPARIDYAKTQPMGEDLRFLADDGTALPHEIERWVPDQRSFVWVLVPVVDPLVGAILYMDYGNPDAVDVQDPVGVWSNGFVAVWHIGEACDDMRDSTGNGLHAECVEIGNADIVDGLAGRAVHLSTATQQLEVPHDAVLDVSQAFTLEAFVDLDADAIATEQTRFALHKQESWALFATREGGGHSHGPRLNVQIDGKAETAAVNALQPGWRAIAGTATQGESLRLFVDGVSRASLDWPSAGVATFGSASLLLGENLGGTLDEVRISAVARTGDWLRLQDASMRDRLLRFGDEVAL